MLKLACHVKTVKGVSEFTCDVILNKVGRRALLSLRGVDLPLRYWRSKDFEVDLIVGDRLAIEIKSTEQVTERHLKGLRAIQEEGVIPVFSGAKKALRKLGFEKIGMGPDFLARDQ